MAIQVFDTASTMIDVAAGISQQTGLLHNDALLVAVMRHHGLTNIASEDSDFDHVPGITRCAPVTHPARRPSAGAVPGR